ncbi:hypothetical protein CYMTET_35358, partial [Cymbomonas tetramitiformis]
VSILLWLATDPRSRITGGSGAIHHIAQNLPFNLDRLPLLLRQSAMRDVRMQRSRIHGMLTDLVVQQLTGQLLWVATGALRGMLDNVTGALELASTTVSSMGRGEGEESETTQAHRRHIPESLPGALLGGTEEVVKGVLDGVSGVFVKPMQGAAEATTLVGGVNGFVNGLAEGAIGMPASIVGGVLNFASRATEGLSTTMKQVHATFTGADLRVPRRRPPRAIGIDGIIRPYSLHDALGQHVLRCAQVNLVLQTNARSFARDTYEAHFALPHETILMLTDLQVILLTIPAGPDPKEKRLLDEPCLVEWTIPYERIVRVELQAPLISSNERDLERLPRFNVVLHTRSAAPVSVEGLWSAITDQGSGVEFQCYPDNAKEINNFIEVMLQNFSSRSRLERCDPLRPSSYRSGSRLLGVTRTWSVMADQGPSTETRAALLV